MKQRYHKYHFHQNIHFLFIPLRFAIIIISMKLQLQHYPATFYLFLLCFVKCDYFLSGTITATTPSLALNYTVGSPLTATILFKVTNQAYSNLALLVDVNPIGSLNITAQSLSKYYTQSNAILQQMDIPRVIGGYSQLISIKVPYGSNTLYFMLYNLDLPNVLTNKSYSIQIATSIIGSVFCYDCPPTARLTLVNGACQCSPCPDNTYGPACEFYIRTISQNNLYNATFYKIGNLYFRIVNPPKTILLTASELNGLNATTLYWQYETVVGGIAGPLNTYIDQNNQPFSRVLTKNANTISIETLGQNISLTIACRQQVSIVAQLSYTDPNASSNSNLGLIIGLAIGIPLSVLTIFFIFFCVYCRRRTFYNPPKNAPVNQFLLTQQEINRYLPEVPSELALKTSSLQQSCQNLKQKEEENEQTLNQCCICLAQIVQNEKIRVGYCRHFFHSKCLIGWFAKNQSCPYCRMQFNYSQTLTAYQSIKKKGPDLAGEKLVKAILNVENQAAKQKAKSAEKQLKVSQQRQVRAERSGEYVENGLSSLSERQDRNTSTNQRYLIREPDPILNIEPITASLGQFQIQEH